jgi:hypothetical protein
MHLLLYLDPGSGSFLIQLLLGLLLGGALAVRIFWSNIKALFTGKKATPPAADDDSDDEQV